MECCRSDQALSEKRLALLLAGVEGSFNFLDCKLTYRLRDQAISEITIRGQVARRHSKHLRMTGQIDGVGDNGGARVCQGSSVCQDSDSIGDSQRKTASARPAALPRLREDV